MGVYVDAKDDERSVAAAAASAAASLRRSTDSSTSSSSTSEAEEIESARARSVTLLGRGRTALGSAGSKILFPYFGGNDEDEMTLQWVVQIASSKYGRVAAVVVVAGPRSDG
jgi:hypothetical protein